MIEEIIKNNRSWSKKKIQKNLRFFSRHAKTQCPEILFIGCIDSRVLPHEMTGLRVGKMFVHRNIANLISTNDNSIMATLQFAVKEMKVKHIILCGHYGCGGVQAGMSNNYKGYLGNWVKNINDLYNESFEVLKEENNSVDQWNKMVELNVLKQYENLKSLDIISDEIKSQKLQIHACVYNIENGEMISLK